MAQTAPTLADAIPTPPVSTSPSTFEALADAFFAVWPTVRSQFNALATNVYNNAVDCYNNAVAAAASAAAAAASAAAAAATAGAVAWVNGNTYTLNSAVISQLDFQTYRKITASSITTIDPKNDAVNWVILGTAPSTAFATASFINIFHGGL